MKTATLSLWVNNQPEGVGYDCTSHYLDAAKWTPPEGVVYNADETTISGPAKVVWQAYRSLAQAVAMAGHGDGCEDMDSPVLTACPVELIEQGYTSAAESLARLESSSQETWAAFVASVPSLADVA